MSEKEPVICIIDDSREDREICRRYLQQDSDYRYRFFEAETGEQGLELCRSVRPDCILLDYDLPDITGLELLEALAGSSPTRLVSLPVVMLTGLGDESIALQAMKSGAQDYLVKGEMTAGNLYRAIHNAIERASMRRIVEEQRHNLEMKNQELQAFAYALAHDLKSPLRAIRGFAEIMGEDYNTLLDETGQHYLHVIIKSAVQMNELIDDLLSYTQIEHGPVRFQAVKLSELAQQTLASLAGQIEREQGHVIIQDQLPVIYGDPTLVGQALVNLLDNALKYHSPEQPPVVSLTCQIEGHEAVLCVADKGIGIAPCHHAKIFQIFQRLHGEEEYPGTGIGLAIVKKSVELMRGQLWLESDQGLGTKFYIRLPLYSGGG